MPDVIIPPDRFPRGSEWRRWDLHIHTPLSIVQNYGGDTDENWEQFISEIESLPDEFKVIGINDYIFIEGYKKVLEFKCQGRLPKIDLILPIIELRCSEFSGSSTEARKLNIHIIFDCEEKLSHELIQNQFINGLDSGYKLAPDIEWNLSPTMESLTELGKKVKERSPDGKPIQQESDLHVGFSNLLFERDHIFKLLGRSCFPDKYLIAVGFAEWDQMRWDQVPAVKYNIAETAQFFFTAAPDLASIERHVNSLRENRFRQPLFHGSDAHDCPNIGKSLTWLKADPTFQGLKHAIYETEERVHYGSTAPMTKNQSRVIDSLTISNSNHWFEDIEIPLNQGLVAIVGEKGAGKTALVEMIALAGGDYPRTENDPSSFVRKAFKRTAQIADTIDGCSVLLKWGDNDSDTLLLDEALSQYAPTHKVRYLSQNFIEKKCHPEHATELQEEIEQIIFQHIPVQGRMGETNFEDLKNRTVQSVDTTKDAVRQTLTELNQQIFDLEKRIASLEAKKRQRANKLKEATQLEDQKPKPETDEEKRIERKLALLSGRRNALSEEIATRNALKATIATIRTEIRLLEKHVMKKLEGLEQSFSEIDLKNLYDRIKFEVPNDLDAKLDGKENDIKQEITVLEGDSEKEDTEEVAALVNHVRQGNLDVLTEEAVSTFALSEVDRFIGFLEQKSSIVETTRRTIKDFEEKISKCKKEAGELAKDVEEIDERHKPALPRAIEERKSAYQEYIRLLLDEKALLEEIYEPLREKLQTADFEAQSGIEFAARIEFDAAAYFKGGQDALDFGRKGPFCRAEDSLLKRIKAIADQVELMETTDIFGLIDDLYRTFEGAGEERFEIEHQLRRKATTKEFYDWIFGVGPFKVTYAIKFQGTNIELLSPGKKGIVLLLMYLALDTEGTTPLLIDQPEENLDNKSVYEHLINFFRKAKKRRQIIVITHNPNLVLNTDAEQVIVANFETSPIVYPARITYVSGAVENSFISDAAGLTPLMRRGIREHSLDILEGGKVAFTDRGLKWNIRKR